MINEESELGHACSACGNTKGTHYPTCPLYEEDTAEVWKRVKEALTDGDFIIPEGKAILTSTLSDEDMEGAINSGINIWNDSDPDDEYAGNIPAPVRGGPCDHSLHKKIPRPGRQRGFMCSNCGKDLS